MRVLVIAEDIGQLPSANLGSAVGRSWFSVGAQVALVAIGNTAAEPQTGFAQAMAAFWQLECPAQNSQTVTLIGQRSALISVAPSADSQIMLGDKLAEIINTHPAVERIYLYSDGPETPDGGEEFLGQLCAGLSLADIPEIQPLASPEIFKNLLQKVATRLADKKLTLVTTNFPQEKALGLEGAVGQWAYHSKQSVASRIEIHQKIETLFSATQIDLGQIPGSGAANTLGAAFIGIGGGIATPLQAFDLEAGISQSASLADLIVAVVADFQVDHDGGDTVSFLAEVAGRSQKPIVVISGGGFVPQKEARAFGAEQVYSLKQRIPEFEKYCLSKRADSDVCNQLFEDIERSLAGIARTWVW